MAIVGGAKVTDKIGVLEAFLERADAILIGGAMAFPFLSVQGHSIGDSLCADEDLDPARELLARGSDKLRLPVDLVLGEAFDAGTERRELDGVDVPDGWMGLDIGPRTAAAYGDGDRRAPAPCSGTARWAPSSSSRSRPARGPSPRPWRATPRARPSSAAATRRRPCTSSAWPISVTHLSTGGGASLELIEGKTLPGVEVLS